MRDSQKSNSPRKFAVDLQNNAYNVAFKCANDLYLGLIDSMKFKISVKSFGPKGESNPSLLDRANALGFYTPLGSKSITWIISYNYLNFL